MTSRFWPSGLPDWVFKRRVMRVRNIGGVGDSAEEYVVVVARAETVDRIEEEGGGGVE